MCTKVLQGGQRFQRRVVKVCRRLVKGWREINRPVVPLVHLGTKLTRHDLKDEMTNAYAYQDEEYTCHDKKACRLRRRWRWLS